MRMLGHMALMLYFSRAVFRFVVADVSTDTPEDAPGD